MTKETGVISLGVFMVVEPYLGVPSGWHTFLTISAGIAVAVLGFLLRGEALGRGPSIKKGSSGHHSFVENKAPAAHDHAEH